MGHGTHHHHHHHHGAEGVEGHGARLVVTMVLNVLITIAEVIGGIWSGSLALLSDALHNLSDGVSVAISYVALELSRRKATPAKTFGYKRAEVLAALFNAATLVAISVYLFVEAGERLLFPDPEGIDAPVMILVAGIGLVANTIATLLLKRGAHHSMNIRSAYLHLLADALSSVAVVLGGVLILVWDLTWVDPVLTIAIGIYVIYETVAIVAGSVNILMQGAPRGVEVAAVVERLATVEGVRNPHHVHVWQLNDREVHLSAHFEVDGAMDVASADELRLHLETMLKETFGVEHVTLQLESDSCPDKGILPASGPCGS